MAWLTSLLKRPKAIDGESAPENEPQPPQAASGPPLAILAPDIGGTSSFRLQFFPDTATAAADIEQLSPEMRRGTHAFWALHDEPVLPPEGQLEALVLIRANHTSDIVYAVSFVDMKSAWSFARFEAKRGLDVSHLIILWAAFATVREELDGISVLPAAPPPTKALHAGTSASRGATQLETTETVRELAPHEEPPISDADAAPEAAEEARIAEAEAEAERREEEVRRTEAENAARIAEQAQEEIRAAREAAAAEAAEEARIAEAETKRREEEARRAAAEEAARIAAQAQEELRVARAAADAARAQAEAETARREEAEHRLEEHQQAAEAAARARAQADMASRIESARTTSEDATEEPAALTDYAPDDEAEPAAHGTVFAHNSAIETEEDTETPEIPEHLRREDDSDDPTDDLPKNPELDEFDIAYEVARLLENRRFDKREEPFQGFDSPPGKF